MIGIAIPGPLASASSTGSVPLSVKVVGNRLVDGTGRTVVLRGADRSGPEYACAQGWGIFDGPSDQASVAAIASWHINAVRVQLNEDCWLDINGVNPAVAGSNYQDAIVSFVNLLNSYGIYAILDLTAVDPGTTLAGLDGVQPMPDQDHSPAFWTSVATTFQNNPAVIFDLYNEPHPAGNTDTPQAWTCWRDGGNCDTFPEAGMQELLDAVRATGATNVVTIGGIGYSNVFDQWATYQPVDPKHQLVADFHNYDFDSSCANVACWNSMLTQIGHIPLITGEMGFSTSYINSYMDWADRAGVSYLAWTWDAWKNPDGSCSGQALISDYSGTPCDPYGTDYQEHLLALAPPAITSPNSVAFAAGAHASFTVATSGFPTPVLSEIGRLPAGLTFTDNGDGTATLAGTPTTAGTFEFRVLAVNGVGPLAVQSLSVTVASASPA
jgi:hypothetical protein